MARTVLKAILSFFMSISALMASITGLTGSTNAPKKNRARRPAAEAPAPAPAPKPAEEEDDLSDLLTGPAASEDAVMRR